MSDSLLDHSGLFKETLKAYPEISSRQDFDQLLYGNIQIVHNNVRGT